MATDGAFTRTDYNARAAKIADELIELLKDHERRQHGGLRCDRETVNLLAYMAHRMGIHVASDAELAVHEFLERVRDYTAIHEEHT